MARDVAADDGLKAAEILCVFQGIQIGSCGDRSGGSGKGSARGGT
jgi:hypothetical protein